MTHILQQVEEHKTIPCIFSFVLPQRQYQRKSEAASSPLLYRINQPTRPSLPHRHSVPVYRGYALPSTRKRQGKQSKTRVQCMNSGLPVWGIYPYRGAERRLPDAPV